MTNAENAIPSPDLKATPSVLRSNRESLQESIAANEEKLAAAKQTYEALIAKRSELNGLLNDISPFMSMLSLDIIAEIFQHVCAHPEDGGSRKPPHFVVGGVCRAWRNIAWSTPSLWTVLSVTLSGFRFRQQEKLIEEWIDRVKACPLSLRLEVSRLDRLCEWEPPQTFFDNLLKTCSQWKEFKLGYPSVNFPRALNSSEDERNFAALRVLSLAGRPPIEGTVDVEKWKFNHPPRLEEIHVVSDRQLDIDINWLPLTAIDCTLKLESCIQIMDFCSTSSSLTSLRFNIPGGSETRMQGVTFVCSSLQDLSLRGSGKSIGFLLSICTVPSSKKLSLEIHNRVGHSTHWPEHCIAMAQRSKFELVDLQISQHGSIIGENHLSDILDTVPSLEYLILRYPPTFSLSDPILKRLTLEESSTDSPLSDAATRNTNNKSLNALKRFEYTGPISLSLDALYTFLASREQTWDDEMEVDDDWDETRPNFQVVITYTNKTWFYNRNPNDLHNFYKNLESLEGIDLQFEILGS